MEESGDIVQQQQQQGQQLKTAKGNPQMALTSHQPKIYTLDTRILLRGACCVGTLMEK